MSLEKLKDFRNSDIKPALADLSKESTSPDKIKTILKTLWNGAAENRDFGGAILASEAIETLVNLYNSERGNKFKGQIVSILVMLVPDGRETDVCLSDITVTALSGIFLKSDLDVFLQCLSGIKIMSSSCFSSSSLPSPSVPDAIHFLSVMSSALILEKASILLSSTTYKDTVKQEVLGDIVELVESGAMNEAAEFAGWRELQPQPQGKSTGGGGGGGGVSNNGGGDASVATIPVVRFTEAFEAFANVIKKISLDKKKLFLSAGAERIYNSIQEKKFFPSSASPITLSLKENLPLRFLNKLNPSHVINEGHRLYWKSCNGYNSFYVEPEIVEGIYKIALEGNNYDGWIEFGLSEAKALNKALSNPLCYCEGVCHIRPSYIYCGAKSYNVNSFSNSGKVTLTMELDANKHVLYFSPNETQIPYCVINVPKSVYFVVCACNSNSAIELKSFARLPVPSISSSMKCTEYAWQ